MSVTRSKGENPDPARPEGWARGLYRFLSSIKFTILLLSLIAAGSIIGTVIKQRAPLEEYLSLYSENTFRFIRFFSLDDTYHSPWFYGLIVFFVINLVLCTTARLSRFIKTERTPATLPEEQALIAMELHFTARDGERIEGELRKSYRQVLATPEGAVFEKGRISRYGVYIIHGSIILILLGGLIGTLFGYKGYVTLNKGETQDRILLRGDAPKEQPLGFGLKCKDFKVTFYPGGEPKDYVSTLEIIDKGKTVLEKEVRVNDPLSYRGIHVYQASYGRSPSFLFNIGGENAILRERETFRKGDLLLMVVRFANTVHNFGPGVLIAYLDKGKPSTSWFLRDVARLKEKELNGVPVRLDSITEEYYTGLEVSKDPGIWVVWAGFALILAGLYVNFFTFYRRIYVRRGASGVIAAGVAPKRRDVFREEFSRIRERVGADES